MLLSAYMLNNVSDVNHFDVVQSVQYTQGDTTYIYFQLIDSSVNPSTQGFCPSGRRYVPAVGATLVVTLQSIDSTKTATKTATQPFTTDPSIWRISMASTDQLVGSRDMLMALTESGVLTHGRVRAAVSIYSQQESF